MLTLDGEPVSGPSRKVGFMPQRDQLFEWRTIRDNVTLGLAIRHELTPERLARVDTLLARYGLAEFAAKRPAQLSGGMRQRCALIGRSRPTRRYCCSTSHFRRWTIRRGSPCRRISTASSAARARPPCS